MTRSLNSATDLMRLVHLLEPAFDSVHVAPFNVELTVGTLGYDAVLEVMSELNISISHHPQRGAFLILGADDVLAKHKLLALVGYLREASGYGG